MHGKRLVRPPCLTFEDTGDVLNLSKLEKTISRSVFGWISFKNAADVPGQTGL